MIIQVPVGKKGEVNISSFTNSDKAHMNGLELIGSYDFGSLANYIFSLKAYVNATIMFDSKVKMDKDDTWKQLESVRKQNITFGLEYSSPRGLELALNGRFLGQRYERNWFGFYPDVRKGLAELLNAEMPEIAKHGQLLHPASLIFSASAHYNVNDNLRLGVNLNNIFDEHYTEKDGYHMPGRNVRFSATYRF